MRLAAGLRPDPLEAHSVPHTPSWIQGILLLRMRGGMRPILYRDLGDRSPCWWRFGAVGSDVGQINEVTLRRARLVLGWVTVWGFNSSCGKFILV